MATRGGPAGPRESTSAGLVPKHGRRYKYQGCRQAHRRQRQTDAKRDRRRAERANRETVRSLPESEFTALAAAREILGRVAMDLHIGRSQPQTQGIPTSVVVAWVHELTAALHIH